MPYGTLALDEISTSGALAITGNVTSTGTLQPSALRGTAANSPPVFQDSVGTQIGTLCRAWVNFNGNGTVAIRAAFNVSTITDNGTGAYTVNFTNPMPDENYAVATTQAAPGSRALINYNTLITNFTAPAYGMTVGYYNSTSGGLTPNDAAIVTVAIFR